MSNTPERLIVKRRATTQNNRLIAPYVPPLWSGSQKLGLQVSALRTVDLSTKKASKNTSLEALKLFL